MIPIAIKVATRSQPLPITRAPDTSELRSRSMTDEERRAYCFALEEFQQTIQALATGAQLALSDDLNDAGLLTPRQRAHEKFSFASGLAAQMQQGFFHP